MAVCLLAGLQPKEFFVRAPGDLGDPVLCLGVARLLSSSGVPPPPPPASRDVYVEEAAPPPHATVAYSVEQFVDAQPRGTVFPSSHALVDALFEHARANGAPAVTRVPRDSALAHFLRLSSGRAKYSGATDSWTLRPVRKRDLAGDLDLDALVGSYLGSLTQRSMGVTRDELLAGFRRYVAQTWHLDAGTCFSDGQILRAFHYIDDNPFAMAPLSELYRRYTQAKLPVHTLIFVFFTRQHIFVDVCVCVCVQGGQPVYALGRDGEHIVNPGWDTSINWIVRDFFKERARAPSRRATLAELLQDIRAYLAERGIHGEFYSDRDLKQAVEFNVGRLREEGYARVRQGQAYRYEYGHYVPGEDELARRAQEARQDQERRRRIREAMIAAGHKGTLPPP
jgi:hypothetical protein